MAMSLPLHFSEINLFFFVQKSCSRHLQVTHGAKMRMPKHGWPHQHQAPSASQKVTCLIPAAARMLLGLHGCQLNDSLDVTALTNT